MDDALVRRDKQCWFRQPNVGRRAISDMGMLKAAIFVLLRRHFVAEEYYVDLVELFTDVRRHNHIVGLT